MSQFNVEPYNPNEEVGGGGCLGNGDTKSEDCVGPYVVFYASATDSNTSPHAVLCKHCLDEAYKATVQPDADEPAIELPPEDVEELPEDDIPVV